MPIITLPTPGASEGVWGTELNAAVTALNTVVDEIDNTVKNGRLSPEILTATITAASPAVKAPAATGSDQTAALNAAISSAAVFGLWLQLNGSHIIADRLTVVDGAKIDGAGGTLTQTGNLKSGLFINAKTGVRVRNLRATGKTTDYVDSSSVYPAAAVFVTGGSSDISIDDCELLGWAGAGVYISGDSSHVRVRNTKMTGPGSAYVVNNSIFGGGVITMNGASHWSVIDCDISGFAQGIATGEGSYIHVTGNRVHDIPGQHGFYFTPVTHTEISNNTVWNCAYLGMKIQIASSSTIDADTVTIANNRFSSVGTQGILLTNINAGAGLKLRNIQVTGNIVKGAGLAGIEANNCAGLHIADNRVVSAQTGIKIDTCVGVTVNDDTLSTFTRSGVVITSCTDVVADGLRIKDPGSEGNTSDRFGLLINGTSADITIRDFKITDSTSSMAYGIYLSAGDSATMDFIGNQATGATAYGWRMQTAGNVRTMRGNVFQGTTGSMTVPPTNFAQNADTTGATLTALETEVNELKAVLRAAGLIRT